ncbi:Transposon Tf2-1 polyprotein [Ceratobasidium sp. AG-Ba]|nr:Transposon Tf2-1 polyprotein [Ceratobasidium sp. AG-Ba]
MNTDLWGGESRTLLDPALFIAAIEPDKVIDDRIRDAYLQDERLNHIVEALQKNDKVKNWSWENGLLIFKNKIYVPNNDSICKDILASRHDNIAVGHPGQFRTLELINRKYYWKSLKKSVNAYVSNCESCIRNKHSNQLPQVEMSCQKFAGNPHPQPVTGAPAPTPAPAPAPAAEMPVYLR